MALSVIAVWDFLVNVDCLLDELSKPSAREKLALAGVVREAHVPWICRHFDFDTACDPEDHRAS